MFRNFPAVAFSCILVACASGLNGQTPAYTGGANARPLLSGPVDETKLTVLAGNTHLKATAQNDRGIVAETLPMSHMQLVLQRPPELERELDTLMQEQQEKSSPNYHKWLTAAQFSRRFGVSPSDIERVSSWLTSRGFHVDSVAPSGMSIEFSGTAGHVKQAFHTEIHNLEVDGVKHISNMSDPRIPTALTGVVKGIHSLNDFMPHTMYKKKAKSKYTEGGGYYALVPADLATIYNLNPAFQSGLTGAGQTVVVIEDTNVYNASDISTFRSTFGLSGYHGTFTQVQPSGANTCGNPGAVSGNEGEATLDAEWAAASAPGAAIELASCSDTETVFGGLLALQNLINGANVPKIVSISYGECEPENGAAANLSYYNAYKQAASEGVSVFVSSGDEGAASCDADQGNATHGISVSAFTSTPYNVSVGGTDYADLLEGTSTTYWSSTNSSTYGSALSYIYEIPWNDSCASVLLSDGYSYGSTYGSTGFCNSDEAAGDGYITTASGSGGPSNCYSGVPSVGGVAGGTCKGQPKPSWQSVLGNPSDGVRDIPDVSLFAANGVYGHYYVYCDSDVEDGQSCSGAPSDWSGAGGTSFSSPILAGVQALINQSTGTSAGNPNPRFYGLANLEYGSTGSSTCDSELGNAVGSSCVFYDVTAGDMDVNCTGTHNCYKPSGTYGVLSTSNSAYDPAYGTQTGWDFATGLGTVNVYNLIKNWTAVQTTMAVGSSANPSTVGEKVIYSAIVTPSIGSSETGTIVWSSNTGCAQSAISNGSATCSVTWSTSGQQTVTATYSGDSNYAGGSIGSVSQQVNAATSATMTSPTPGSTFTGSSVTFNWTAVTGGAPTYALWIGTTGVGSHDLLEGGYHTATTLTFSTMPINGEKIYVRLYTSTGAGALSNDYTFNAESGQATMTSPAPISTFSGPSATFNWTTVSGATGYALWIGTTGAGSHDLLEGGVHTATSLTFTALPTGGQTIYVRLYTDIGGTLSPVDYTYTAAAQATMISPAQSSTLTGPSQTFTWSAGTNASGYALWLGTTGVGSSNLLQGGIHAATSLTFNSIPTSGGTIYARLFTSYNGTLKSVDYSYSAAAQAVMLSPTPSSTLSSSNVTFTWSSGVSATGYALWVGTTGVGSHNLLQGGIHTVNSFTMSGLPTNGSTIYVRLYTNFNGTLEYTDYTYTAQ